MSRAKPWKDGSCGGGGGFGNVDPKDQQRALLDQLMGTMRDEPVDSEARDRVKFHDRNVCKFYLVGMSPWRLMRGTKSEAWVQKTYARIYEREDEGDSFNPDSLVCEPKLKSEYDQLPDAEKERYGYEELLLRCICDPREAVRPQDRAESDRIQEAANASVTDEEILRMVQLDNEVKAKTARAEELGEQGDVDESLELMREVESLRAAKVALGRPRRRHTTTKVARSSSARLPETAHRLGGRLERRLDGLALRVGGLPGLEGAAREMRGPQGDARRPGPTRASTRSRGRMTTGTTATAIFGATGTAAAVVGAAAAAAAATMSVTETAAEAAAAARRRRRW